MARHGCYRIRRLLPICGGNAGGAEHAVIRTHHHPHLMRWNCTAGLVVPVFGHGRTH